MPTHSSILLIEDSPGECELFRLALTQTGLDVALYTEHDAEAALHFLNDRYHQSSNQARSYPLQEGGLTRSPTARIDRAHSDRARSASTGDRSGLPSLILLDLQLSGQNGCDFLKRLRSRCPLRRDPCRRLHHVGRPDRSRSLLCQRRERLCGETRNLRRTRSMYRRYLPLLVEIGIVFLMMV